MYYDSFYDGDRDENGMLQSVVLYHPFDTGKTINVYRSNEKYWFDALDVALHLGYDVDEDDDVGVHYEFMDGIVGIENRIDSGCGYIAVDMIGLLDLIKESKDEYRKGFVFKWVQDSIFRIEESVEEAMRMDDRW